MLDIFYWVRIILSIRILNSYKQKLWLKRGKWIIENNNIYLETPSFTGRNVSVAEIAKAIGKDPQYVRVGLQKGVLNFGYAFKMENSSEFNYYCPDKKVWEETGYFQELI